MRKTNTPRIVITDPQLKLDLIDACSQMRDIAGQMLDLLDPIAFSEPGSPAHEMYLATVRAQKAASRLLGSPLLEGAF